MMSFAPDGLAAGRFRAYACPCRMAASSLLDEPTALVIGPFSCLACRKTYEGHHLALLELDLNGRQRCRVCLCTDSTPCPGGCFWIEDDLCSTCAAAVPTVLHDPLGTY